MDSYPRRSIIRQPDIAQARQQAAKAWRYLRSVDPEAARAKWREYNGKRLWSHRRQDAAEERRTRRNLLRLSQANV